MNEYKNMAVGLNAFMSYPGVEIANFRQREKHFNKNKQNKSKSEKRSEIG